MTLDDFIKMLAAINDTSGLNKNNIVERIKTKLEGSDLWKWENNGFNVNHIFTTHSDLDPVEPTLLHFAAKSGCENIVRALIKCGAYVDAWNSNGCNPLHFAAKWKHKGIVDILIESGANVNACDNDVRTPLHFAAEGGNENIVETLIEHRAYVDAWDNDRNTPLHFAAKYGNKNVVKTLVKHRVCVNVWNSCGRTPLDFAIDHETRDILMRSGAYVSKQNNNVYASFHFAVKWDCKDVMSFSPSNRTEMAVERAEQITLAERLELF